MIKSENLRKNDSLKQTWRLVSLYFFIPLSIITSSIFHGYQLKNLLNNNLNQTVANISEEGLGTINNLHLFSWLNLTFLILLIFLSIPVVQKRLKIRNMLFKQLDQAEVEKEERIRELEELNTFIRNLYDQAPIGYHSTDPTGLIIEMNQTELDWLGYTHEEVVSKMKSIDLLAPSLKIVDEETEESTAQKLLEHFKEQRFLNNIEAIFQKKTGELFPVLINSKAVFDIKGNFLYSRTVVFDFTERKRMEEAVEQNRNELNRLGLLKSQFMANMSHEIRTPLNAILGFSNLLDRTPLTKDQTEFVKNIKNSGENLLAIINDILDFSKIEAGALRLESIPFNLLALLHSIEQMFTYRADEKQLTFVVKYDENVPDNLLGDPTRLTQILINLLSNAFKFTREGGVSLQVESTKQGEDQLVRFSVKDSGIGISSDQIEHVFERFGQASADTTRVYGGTGLGLTISKQLAELQNGSIRVESEQGVGSTFFLEIPYQVSEKIAPPKAINRAWSQHELAEDISLLIVEDNPLNRRIVELLIDDWGFQYEHAENGELALEMLRTRVFDIILLDIQMPVMDGYKTAEKIRQELGLQIPIIATTAHAFAGEREKCISYGMNDYLSKPIREAELLALIKRYLPNHKQKRSRNEAPIKSIDRPGFDYQYVLEVSRGKPERLREMAELFLSQSAKELNLLEELIQNNNYGQLVIIAHSMKSTVSYMGFGESLGNLLKELELKAGSDLINQTELKTLFSDLKVKTVEARKFIRLTYL